MTTPKWTEERTETLVNYVGDESPVSRATVEGAAELLETSSRSIASKLRKMEFEVAPVTAEPSKFSEAQEGLLRTLVEDNSGKFTYADIADVFEGGAFKAKEIQGKILSMQLYQHVRPAPRPESAKTFTDAQEARFIELANGGSFIEEIAEDLGVEVARARGKALSLLKAEQITSIPKQRDRKASSKVDALEELGDISKMTVTEIAEAIEKSPRGVKTMLTRRGLTASDYDGAAKKEKAAG